MKPLLESQRGFSFARLVLSRVPCVKLRRCIAEIMRFAKKLRSRALPGELDLLRKVLETAWLR
jgi:hypothetical protein